tara:strand:- start:302 stop:733 length:432 start_codon:yes stop_codon:yes gene_type:complete
MSDGPRREELVGMNYTRVVPGQRPFLSQVAGTVEKSQKETTRPADESNGRAEGKSTTHEVAPTMNTNTLRPLAGDKQRSTHPCHPPKYQEIIIGGQSALVRVGLPGQPGRTVADHIGDSPIAREFIEDVLAIPSAYSIDEAGR